MININIKHLFCLCILFLQKDICRIGDKCYHKDDSVCKVNGNTKMDGGINYIQLWTIGAALGGVSIVIILILLIIKRLYDHR